MQTDGQICKTEVVTVRAARSWSNVNWDVSSSIVEKGLLVQHMIFHLIPRLTNSALQQMIEQQKQGAEIWAVQTRPEIAKYEVTCSCPPRGMLIVA